MASLDQPFEVELLSLGCDGVVGYARGIARMRSTKKASRRKVRKAVLDIETCGHVTRLSGASLVHDEDLLG